MITIDRRQGGTAAGRGGGGPLRLAQNRPDGITEVRIARLDRWAPGHSAVTADIRKWPV